MLTISPAGDAALLVTLGEQIDPAVNRRVHALARRLTPAVRGLAEWPLPGAGESVPGYAALLVHYDPLVCEYAAVRAWVEDELAQVSEAELPEPRRVEVPVQYGGDHGPDLADVARHTGLSEAEVVRIHCARDYPVFMLGFMPGFPYLGGMDAAIACPRLPAPRQRVPAGSVGIAGQQTGIYPLESPGGWRIIGRTPLRLFDWQNDPPARLSPGDLVRFVCL